MGDTTASIAAGIQDVSPGAGLRRRVHRPKGGAQAFRAPGVPREGRARFVGGPPDGLLRTMKPDSASRLDDRATLAWIEEG